MHTYLYPKQSHPRHSISSRKWSEKKSRSYRHLKKSNEYCVEGRAPKAERQKCSRGKHKCPIFVEMEEDGGEWPVVQGSRGSELPRWYTHTPPSSSISSKIGHWCKSCAQTGWTPPHHTNLHHPEIWSRPVQNSTSKIASSWEIECCDIYIYIYIIIYTYIPGPSWIRRRQRRWRGVRQQRRRGGLLPTPFLMQHQHRRSPAKKKSESASPLSCFRVKIQLTKDGKSIAAFDPLEILIKKNKDLLEGVTAFYTLAILRTQHASLQVCVCVCVCVYIFVTHTHSLSHTTRQPGSTRRSAQKSIS